MLKVKIIVNYTDLKLNRLVKAGEELEVTEGRAIELIKAKVAESVTTTTTEKVAKPKKKKVVAGE